MISDCHWWCRTPRSQICWSLIWSNHTTTSGRFLLISTLDLYFLVAVFFPFPYFKKTTPPDWSESCFLLEWVKQKEYHVYPLNPQFFEKHWDLVTRQNGVALKSVPPSAPWVWRPYAVRSAGWALAFCLGTSQSLRRNKKPCWTLGW